MSVTKAACSPCVKMHWDGMVRSGYRTGPATHQKWTHSDVRAREKTTASVYQQGSYLRSLCAMDRLWDHGQVTGCATASVSWTVKWTHVQDSRHHQAGFLEGCVGWASTALRNYLRLGKDKACLVQSFAGSRAQARLWWGPPRQWPPGRGAFEGQWDHRNIPPLRRTASPSLPRPPRA